MLFLAGENAHDFNGRLKATFQSLNIDESVACDLLVIPNSFDLAEQSNAIRDAVMIHGELNLVVVDSVASFFGHRGLDENSNTEMLRHATALRALTKLHGNPAVLALAHPTKTATKENLLPRGGGAFLSEIDGNLAAWKDSNNYVTMSWAGKLRGPNVCVRPSHLDQRCR